MPEEWMRRRAPAPNPHATALWVAVDGRRRANSMPSLPPQNSTLPPSERMRNQTDKEPTGPFNRRKLIKFIEEQGKNEKDWEEARPYKKETRGACCVRSPR